MNFLPLSLLALNVKNAVEMPGSKICLNARNIPPRKTILPKSSGPNALARKMPDKKAIADLSAFPRMLERNRL